MLFPPIASFLSALTDFSTLTDDRKLTLDLLIDYINNQRRIGQPVALNFICTHNSRRSHMGQLWAQVAAYYYDISGIDCYSGGTETTACNPRTVAAFQRAGVEALTITNSENPIYLLKYANGVNPMVAFSKVYDQAPNPAQHFAAVMTCSHAEENCPYIPGAEKRFSVLYNDPKAADDTPEESATYDARSRQIAQEMLYVFSRVQA